MANGIGNKEYRSDVFSMLLQDKRRALEIYNAMNGTAYDDPEQVEITTLEGTSFSLTIRNDASFVLDADFSLYEHQSTLCPNMPLRDLIYFVNLIQNRVYAQKRDLYGRKLLKIPVPRFVVFYNGTEHAPEHYELRLSDAFAKETETPELELVCQVYNINRGNNSELLEKSPTLRGYMYFVDLVREYHAKDNFSDLEGAISKAVSRCIREDILKDFLTEHRQEVTRVMTMDYTFERRLEFQREEAIEEGWRLGEEHGRKLGEEYGRKLGEEHGRKLGEEYGRELGEKDGMKKKLNEQIRKKLLRGKSLEQIADELEETPDDIRAFYEQIQAEL